MKSTIPPKLLLVCVLFFAFLAPSYSGDTLKIATYNLLNYPGDDGPTRDPYFRTTMSHMNPDILVGEEVQSQSGVDEFRNSVLNYYQAGKYASVAFHDGPDTDNSLFYKPDKVTVLSAQYIHSGDIAGDRDIAEYVIKPKWSDETLRIYAVHLKASQGFESQRNDECVVLRNYLNALPSGTNFIIVGDYNIYTGTEPCYQTLLANTSDNDGRVKDWLSLANPWNQYNNRFYHTQSPRASAGGLDDRFDMILTSYSSLDDNIILSSYKAYGNDGNHYNQSINVLPNTAVPESVANALYYSSDHLPVVCNFTFPDTIEATTVEMNVKEGWNIISLPLQVSNAQRSLVFPTATSNAYYYNNTAGYVYDITLRTGVAYWLKFSAAQTVSITGKPFTLDTLNVGSGWNLLPMPGDNVFTGDVETLPSNLLQSPFFGFNNGYVFADTLRTGEGYWIKTGGSGKIVLR